MIVIFIISNNNQDKLLNLYCVYCDCSDSTFLYIFISREEKKLKKLFEIHTHNLKRHVCHKLQNEIEN